MNNGVWRAIRDPLLGKTSLGMVCWVYGLLGSIAYSALGMLIQSDHTLAMRGYAVGGLLFSVYVTIATYQCAYNCRSQRLGRFVRVTTVVGFVLLLPLLIYWDFFGGAARLEEMQVLLGTQ
jgi:hypothetical protein